MALEHMIVASDFQDWGTFRDNADAIDALKGYVVDNFDSDTTQVHINGDFLDTHAMGGTRVDENIEKYTELIKKELQKNEQYIALPDEEKQKVLEANIAPIAEKLQKEQQETLSIVDKLLESDEAYSKLSVEQKQQELRNIVPSLYAQTVGSIFKGFGDAGFDLKGIIGNNEGMVFGQHGLEPIPELKNIFSQYGMEFIDDGNIRDYNGLKVFSDVYINNPGVEEPNISGTEEGSTYAKLMSMKKEDTPNVLMFHGNPRSNHADAEGLKKYIDEYEGDTLWVYSGHAGKAGVEGEFNSKNSRIVYINTNKSQSEAKQIFYDTKVENGKIIGIDEYELEYDKAA